MLLDPKEPDPVTGEPAIPTVPCLLARIAAIIDRSGPCPAAVLPPYCRRPSTALTLPFRDCFTAEFLEGGRYAKHYFTEDLQVPPAARRPLPAARCYGTQTQYIFLSLSFLKTFLKFTYNFKNITYNFKNVTYNFKKNTSDYF